MDEAQAAGYADAILLNSQGRVTEASTSNVFAVVGGRLVTPPATAGLLEGITRDTVRALAADLLNTPTEVRDLDRDELLGADEVFLTGTGPEIVPVTELFGELLAARREAAGPGSAAHQGLAPTDPDPPHR
ncbi:aminotransferase class IV [Streptomyces sp. NPDC020096]